MIHNFGRVAHKFFTNTFTTPFKYHRVDLKIPTSVTVSSEEALHLYKEMYILRRMENSAGEMYKAKLIRGFCHLYTGQEAIAVGMFAVFRRKIDSVITSYRCHPFVYLTTGSVVGVLAELAGRTNGCSRGKGGSMHVYGPNFYGGNGIVGAQVPLGAGIAFKNKYVGDGGVNFAMYGDGGANQGQIFETMNMAMLWKLPCIFVCENNIYAMGTSMERSSASTEYYTRGDYVPGVWVNGMDVIACREAVRSCIEYANNTGPIVMEFHTYRYYGHSMSDPGTSYRTRDEVNAVRKSRDPITVFKNIVTEQNIVTEDQIKNINKEVNDMVKKATKEALSGAVPDPAEELAKDIYAQCICPGGAVRGILPTDLLKHNK